MQSVHRCTGVALFSLEGAIASELEQPSRLRCRAGRMLWAEGSAVTKTYESMH